MDAFKGRLELIRLDDLGDGRGRFKRRSEQVDFQFVIFLGVQCICSMLSLPFSIFFFIILLLLYIVQ